MFSERESVFTEYILDYGFRSRKTQGLLSKTAAEGVSTIFGRQIKNGWPRSQDGERGRTSRPKQSRAKLRHG
jgi:hypothetical protein